MLFIWLSSIQLATTEGIPTLHPTIGLTTHNLSTNGHPRALNQLTITKESFVSQHFSPKRMDEGMNESHPPHPPLNRQKNGNVSTCAHSICQHEIFISLF